MNISEKIKRLTYHEGFRSKPYKCTTNRLTQGIGRNIQDNPLNSFEKSHIKNLNCWTLAEAEFILTYDINRCEVLLNNMVRCYDSLDEERKYALLDMCYQMDIKGLLKFKKMLKALENKDFKKAKEECLNSSYAKQTPARAKRIAHLIETGEWKC